MLFGFKARNYKVWNLVKKNQIYNFKPCHLKMVENNFELCHLKKVENNFELCHPDRIYENLCGEETLRITINAVYIQTQLQQTWLYIIKRSKIILNYVNLPHLFKCLCFEICRCLQIELVRHSLECF